MHHFTHGHGLRGCFNASILTSQDRFPTHCERNYWNPTSVGSTRVAEATVNLSVAALMIICHARLCDACTMTGILPIPANLLPQIPPYHGGEQKDRETFQDWLEYFEAVARLARRDEHYQLVYLTTALRGTAKSFYLSRSLAQRSCYCALVAELKKRLTPVRLTAVQTQLFHDRWQGPQESVDDFAQGLRTLYSQAYAGFTRGTQRLRRLDRQC